MNYANFDVHETSPDERNKIKIEFRSNGLPMLNMACRLEPNRVESTRQEDDLIAGFSICCGPPVLGPRHISSGRQCTAYPGRAVSTL